MREQIESRTERTVAGFPRFSSLGGTVCQDPIELSRREIYVSAERRVDRSHTFRQLARITEFMFRSLSQPNTMARGPSSKAMALVRSAMNAVPASRTSWKRWGSPAPARRCARVLDSQRGSADSFGPGPLLFTYFSGLKRLDEAVMQVWFTRKRPKPVRGEGLRAGNYAFVKRRPAQGNGVSR